MEIAVAAAVTVVILGIIAVVAWRRRSAAVIPRTWRSEAEKVAASVGGRVQVSSSAVTVVSAVGTVVWTRGDDGGEITRIEKGDAVEVLSGWVNADTVLAALADDGGGLSERSRGSSPWTQTPDGWTDDLSLPLVPGRTVDELVDYLLARARVPRLELLTMVATRFGLTFNDARLAVDRVAGGQVRVKADKFRVGRNRPDPVKDPIACASYDRGRGLPASAPPPIGTIAWRTWRALVQAGDVDAALAQATELEGTEFEREAASAWSSAIEGVGGTIGTAEAEIAISMVDLAALSIDAPLRDVQRRNVLMQAGTALAGAANACQREPSYAPYCPAWFDAVRLVEAAGGLASLFERTGSLENAAKALDLRRSLTARMLADARARVGVAMLEYIAIEQKLGESQRVADLCEALLADFWPMVDDWEERTGYLADEDELAARQIVAAVEIRAAIREPEAVYDDLHRRCLALLARIPRGA